jgi:hypothetical protein
MAIPQKPKLLYQVEIKRSSFLRRFLWSFLGAVAAVGALVALDEAAGRGVVDYTVLQIGGAISIVVLILFGLRTLINLWRFLRRRTETLRIFDKGFVWTTPIAERKYSWSELYTYREGGRGLYIGKRSILQWGAHRLQMQDRQVFRITGAYGDFRKLGALIRRYAAHVTGIQMAKRLRDEQPMSLHSRLTLWPGGVQVGRREIPWSQVEVKLKNNRLSILERGANGKFKTVRAYNARQVDNVGGFMELATATIRNHQRERFEKT